MVPVMTRKTKSSDEKARERAVVPVMARKAKSSEEKAAIPVMARKAGSRDEPSVPVSSQKDIEYSRELAIGALLVAVVLVLLFGFCIASTEPQSERGAGSVRVRESISTPQGAGGNGGMTLQQAIKRAL